jgi:hypothetical protein
VYLAKLVFGLDVFLVCVLHLGSLVRVDLLDGRADLALLGTGMRGKPGGDFLDGREAVNIVLEQALEQTLKQTVILGDQRDGIRGHDNTPDG